MLGTNDEPVLLGSEEDAVDSAVDLLLGEEFAVDEVPNDNVTVLATGSEEVGLGNHGKRVDLSGVTNKGVLKSHGLIVPNLDGLIPRSANNDGSLGVLEELNAGDPVGVGALLDGELALTNSVPDLEVLVSTTASNLSVVRGESDGEDVSGVADESLDCLTLLQVPEAESTVPRSRENVSAVLREGEVAYEVRVT